MDNELKDILSNMKNSLTGFRELCVDYGYPFHDCVIDDAIAEIIKVKNGK